MDLVQMNWQEPSRLANKDDLKTTPTSNDQANDQTESMTQDVATNSAKLHRHGLVWQRSPLFEKMWQTQVKLKPMPQASVQAGNDDSMDDIELCVEVGGDPNNPPLLLIMGLGSQLIFWTQDFVARLIDAGFYVIRFDNRDSGLSTKVSKTGLPKVNTVAAMLKLQLGLTNATPVAYKLTDVALDVARLIHTLGLRQPYVLGASMGGMIAQILAAQYPHLVGKLALLFTSNNRPLLPPTKPKQLYTLIKPPASHDKADIIAHGHWFISNIGSSGHIDDNLIKHLAQVRFERCFYPLGTVQQLNAILLTGSMRQYSRAIAAPTLILHGSEDGLVPTSHGKALAKDIPNASFVEIEGMGHDLPSYFQPFIVSQLKHHFLTPT